MTFTSVRRELLQQAFATAHRASQSDRYTPPARLKFYQIAELIWKAHGEEGEMPPDAGERAAGLAAEIIKAEKDRLI